MERNRSDVKREPSVRKPSGAAVMQESVTRAIEAALFREWARTGYAALSVEAVAKRAGVGKAAIYRRWPSKLALVSDVLTRVGSDLAVAPDTGDLRSDIELLLRQLRRVLRHPLVARILPDLHAEMPRTPELAKAIRSRLQSYRRSRAEEVLRRAVSRGELSNEVDLDLATDLLGSMIYWRMIVTRLPADRAYLDRLTDLIVGALKTYGEGE
ncbi:TetR/AcrR family transcriptional regulator [Microvirga arsenatis]|uniref:TetR family transcriptional regulator n=1 Tax=Microvirga arsenatis TaxID=2692265 RepID=A0ABW9YYJ6_9HYPH|nr:TetR/AcrR family transcriptional regulator [Microvirga arsenatis]NBJ11191.1 TetR family transcriptional regulator [Microvirga arsenatis]NBJ25464.1 TetR family transcriptional regulator [Microvirga arsenatis]